MLKTKRGYKTIECYEIGNVYYPIVYKVDKKVSPQKREWLKALQSIK